ncbi:MAG: Rrf2 family transcriptional regulator [Actinobacteria bacterium]|nr:Rrf2 family transcriptional regulator [Actinomycetota bacterium]
MKLITKQTDYAIRALGAMAKEKDSIFTTSFLAEKLKISKPFVRAILQKLNKEHVLVSYKGKGGGFKMALPPDKVSIVSLIKIFQGPIKVDHCLIKSSLCPDIKTCPLRKKLKEIGSYINKEFESLTLAKLLE